MWRRRGAPRGSSGGQVEQPPCPQPAASGRAPGRQDRPRVRRSCRPPRCPASRPTLKRRPVEQAACNVCGAPAGARLFSAMDYLTEERFEVVACARCALAFVNPRPAGPELGRYYPPVYYGPRRSVFDAVTMKLRVRRVERIHGGRPGRVLDIGCGHGGTLRALRARGWEVAGTEFGSRPDTVPGDLDIRYAPLEACGLPAGSFDVVTMWH